MSLFDGRSLDHPYGVHFIDDIFGAEVFLHPLEQSYGRGQICGCTTQHIPSWKTMPEVKSVQLNDRAALDLPFYIEGLRDDQILYINYFDGMPCDQIQTITGGERVVFVGEFDEQERELLIRRKM